MIFRLSFGLMLMMLAGCQEPAATTQPAAKKPNATLQGDDAQLPDGRPRKSLTAAFRKDIKVDGDLSDWMGVPFHIVTPENGLFDPSGSLDKGKDRKTASLTDDPQDLSFRFAVCHDDAALYVAVMVVDDRPVADTTEPGQIEAHAWEDDAVEVFIDGNHNRAVDSRLKDGSELKYGGEFALVANGAAMSNFSGYPKTFNTKWQGATNWAEVQAGKTQRVCYEFRLPWGVMGGKVRPGDTIGFNICVQDDDDGNRRDHALYYTGVLPALFSNEAGFADLYLEPKK